MARRAVVLVALAILAAGACARRPERVLRVVLRSPLRSLDPLTTDDYTSLMILGNVYDSLVRLDELGRVVPSLATSWSSPEDNVWHFDLRRGVRFHDGRELSAVDVKLTIDRGLSEPGSWLKSSVPLLESARVLAQHTVEIATRGPSPLLLNQLTAVMIEPGGASPPGRAIGTGPYRLASWSAGDVVLERADPQWRKGPRWTRVVFSADPDGRARLELVLRGERDMAESPRVEDLPRIQASGNAQLIRRASATVAILGLCATPEPGNPFADAGVRRAIASALDRRALVREAHAGHAAPASQLVPPGAFGFVPEIVLPEPDLERARKALQASRFPRGLRAPLYFTERDASLARLVAKQAAAVGVVLELREVEWADLDRRLLSRQAPAFLVAMTFPNRDASDMFSGSFHTPTPDRGFGALNFAGYSDPELDRLIEASEAELRPEARYELLRQVMARALQADVFLPLSVPFQLYAARKGLRWEGDPTDRLHAAAVVDEGSLE